MGSKPDPQDFLPLPNLPFHILLALADLESAHGWVVIKRIREMSGGATKPSSGSLYLAMVRLEDRGLLREVAAPPGETDARRRFYELTSLGRRVLEAEVQRLGSLLAVARNSGITG